MAQSQQVTAQAQPTQLTYVDRPEISETFADSLWRVTVDNMVVKMEFVVNRMDDPNPPTAPTGRATTSSRVVISLPGMIDMLTKLQAIMAQLQASGVIRQIQNPPTSGRPN
jgi:hypothetical protein